MSAFAVIAIFLACLGLLGLTSFTAERRTREIGIRKTLGASNRSIVFMLMKDILVWGGLGVVAAFPAAYATKFAYRIEISPAPIMLATAGIILSFLK